MKGQLWQKGRGVSAAVLPVETFKEGDVYIANCSVLRVASHGKTEREAEKALREAMDLFFEELEKKGTLEEVLLEAGWRKVRRERREYMVPPEVHHTSFSISPVPVPA